MTVPEINTSPKQSELNGLEIAVIGMAGRFPGASSVDIFWQNLRNGVESISFFSNEELIAEGISADCLDNPKFVKAKGLLEDIEWFDASYFGYTPREAEIMDPQQRVFLECAVTALENAGYNPDTYKGLIGVYAGTGMNTYLLKNLYSNPELIESVGDFETMIANDKDFLTTRVSYKLNLEGPSVAVQTACSTSLVAVCMACQSLLSGECDMVLAGGVSIHLPKKCGFLYQEGGILSPDGHCRAFDAKAQGTPFSSAAGIVVLKRLEEALQDKDNIYAVIKGSALNNDGSFKVGFTAPRVDGQAKAIKAAQIMADIEPSTISYIEAHGTGTPLGDPIEVAALKQVFDAASEKKSYCAIGSLKTNIGHADAAAGIAGLIKTVLMLKYKEIAPSLHFEAPNPKIELDNSPFYVSKTLKPWPVNGYPRRAGVSSFGIGGTNAHIVLEEAPQTVSPQQSRPWQLLLLSAQNATSLNSMTVNLSEHLKRHPDIPMEHVAYTLKVGRKVLAYRRMVVCRDREDAIDALFDEKRLVDTVQEHTKRKPVFMFSGQGTQYVDMGVELYREEAVFREQIDRCAQILEPLLGLDLHSILYPDAENCESASQQIGQTVITQVALFVIEYSLARLWMAWGVRPSAMVGHSIGEYVAACLAGVFSLEDGLFLVATRGRMMQEMPKGSMIAVALSEREITPFLSKEIALAAVNSAALCVLSGEEEAIEKLSRTLSEKRISSQPLHTSHAFHSHMMTPMVEKFVKHFDQVRLKAPTIPFISNVTGNWIKPDEATDPSYWARHLRQTVRFADAIQALSKESDRVFLEIGPGNTLSTFARQYLGKNAVQSVVSSLRHPKDQTSDRAVILNAIGRLWMAGIQPDWSAYYADLEPSRIPLPTYSFNRKRFWVEPKQLANPSFGQQVNLVKKPNISDWFYVPTWKTKTNAFQTENIVNHAMQWMVFMDGCGVGEQVTARLRQLGQMVTCVTFGEQFVKQSDQDYMVNPERPDDYDKLLTNLQQTNQIPQKIIHLGNVATNAPTNFDTIQQLGFYSLLFLAQTIGNQGITEPIQIAIITNGMQPVTGDEEICPQKATVLGPCKVIPKEYPNITCVSIDIEAWESTPPYNRDQIDSLLGEFYGEFNDIMVAYRGSDRWIQSFEKIEPNDFGKKLSRLRKGGVYLITGGLGGIGLTIADYLSKKVQAKLVLVSRSPLPDREKWQQLLENNDENDDLSRKIKSIQTMESNGSKVLIANADVSDEQQMGKVINRAKHRFGCIHGLIHAAGVLNDGIVQLKSQEEANKVLAPKVKGTLVLDSLLTHEKLDFFILFSSISSILAPAGQVDYCAANAFLDAFAQRQPHNKTHFCVSINWNMWQEVGLAIGTSAIERFAGLAIMPEEGVNVFELILALKGTNRIIVSTIDLDEWTNLESSSIEQVANTDKIEFSKHETRAGSSKVAKSKLDDIEKVLTSIWEEQLGIKGIGIHDDFFELGGSSLLALRIFAQIEKLCGKNFPLATLYQAPTIHQMAGVIQHDELKPDWSSLVEIQPNGSNPPLFLMHGAGGNILLYRDLVRHLGDHQPVYGLQSKGLDGQSIYHHRVEDMAAHYIREIKSVQPEGPYYLGGYCLGGTIALEMAQQLLTNSERVAFLALFETYNWANIGTETFFDRSYFNLQRIVFHFLNFNLLKLNDKYKFFCEKFNVAKNRRKVWYGNFFSLFRRNSQLTNRESSHLSELWKINDLAAMNYLPILYPGTITHFRPSKEYARHNSEKVGWHDLAAGGVETHKLPVYPAGMLLEPFVGILAERLKSCIECAVEFSEYSDRSWHIN